jgi:hypothetical protein
VVGIVGGTEDGRKGRKEHENSMAVLDFPILTEYRLVNRFRRFGRTFGLHIHTDLNGGTSQKCNTPFHTGVRASVLV